MKIRNLLVECRSYLAVILKCLVASACICFCADYPSIVVCEDTSVLLISARICGYLTILDIILCLCRVVKQQTILCIEVLVDRLKCLDVRDLVLASLRHNCESLWLDENIHLYTFIRTHFYAW